MEWFCINLDERTDRLFQITKHCEDLEILFTRFSAIKRQNGTLGCVESHIGCLELAIARKIDYVIIMEDDCEFLINKNEIDNYINNFLQSDSPVMVFGATSVIRKKYNSIFDQGKKILSATCYIVKNFYFDILKNTFMISFLNLTNNYPYQFNALDIIWHNLQDKDIWLIPTKLVIQQRPSYSNILNTYVDYRPNFISMCYSPPDSSLLCDSALPETNNSN